MRLILFDIDGTLLWTDGAGRRAIRDALVAEVGTAGPIDTYGLDGKTDPQIVRDLLALAGIAEPEITARLDGVLRRYLELLEAELAKPDQATKLMTGVPELLRALEPHEARGQTLVGLLTGNLERGAALKLGAAGLAPARFAVGAFGSDSPHRPDLPAVAARRAAVRTGREFRGPDVVVVGDTPEDIACGRPIGARAVAVATGRFSVHELRAAGPAHVFPDLADTAAVLAALLG
jgi:phosphoglycolate phosphatase-like HAD superfamily hydrolase